MAHCPDFSDSDDSLFADDDDYYEFKKRMKNLNKPGDSKVVISEKSLREQQLKLLFTELSSGSVQNVIERLDKGLDVNVNVNDGWTPVLLAVSYGNPELTDELIKRGADVNANRDGTTALMMACNCPDSTSSLKVIKQLVDEGAKVKTRNRKRMNALMFAANAGNLEAVKFLLPLSDKCAEDNQRWNVLYWAINGNQTEVVKYLLYEGFEVNLTDIRGNTPLDIAKNNDFESIVRLFPTEEEDLISRIIDRSYCEFEDNFKGLKAGEKPRFFLDICNILCAVRNENVIKIMSEKNVSLGEFLSVTDEELKNLDVVLPYQRNRILGGLHRFHKHPFHPKSLHIVPLNESYSNLDVAKQLLTTIKQAISMAASLKYLIKHLKEDISEPDLKPMEQNVKNIRNRIKMCQIVTEKLLKKTKEWDECIKPADLITKRSLSKFPWRKFIFSFSVISVIVAFRIYK